MSYNKKAKQTRSSVTDEALTQMFNGQSATVQVNDKKYVFELRDTCECIQACPAGVNVKAYVNLIANRRFEEAIDVIRLANPFPAVCGRVCTRPCEESCELSEVGGDPVAIRALKRYASEYEITHRSVGDITPLTSIYAQKIAIVGSGPSGLTAAVDLLRMGYQVTVFEARDEPGGLLRYAIPPYRLPDWILKKELQWIQNIGVDIQTSSKIDDPNDLLQNGYDAVLLAVGAPVMMPLKIPGEHAEGVIDPLQLLREVNTTEPVKISGKTIVVIGGGSTAFDVARSAVRLHAKKVVLAYRRGKQEMPAEPEEISDAEAEGVTILTLAIPKRIIVEKNKVTGVECYKAKLGKPDKTNRRKPVPIKQSEFVIPADIVIPAIGAKPDINLLGKIQLISEKGHIQVNQYGETTVPGIFAAGDVELGPASIVDAIGRGHKAAEGIHAYIQKTKTSKIQKDTKKMPIIVEKQPTSHAQYSIPQLGSSERTQSFAEVEGTITEYETLNEAARCSSCGPCTICTICLPNCQHKQAIAQIDNIVFPLKIPLSLARILPDKETVRYPVKFQKTHKDMTMEKLVSSIDTQKCISCGRCQDICSYRAIRNVFTKKQESYMEVIHDACAACGACISVCPTGAITQGYMSDDTLLHRLAQIPSPYPGVKALVDYWSTDSNIMGSHTGVIELMSARKISPMFLIRALARTGKALLVIGPDEVNVSHYLPWEERPLDAVLETKKLLQSIGISSDRIQYTPVQNKINPSIYLDNYSKKITQKKLTQLTIPIPQDPMNPLVETMMLLRMLSAQPDQTPQDPELKISPMKNNDTALFEGCLPLLALLGGSLKLFDLRNTRQNLHELLHILGISYGVIPELSCPAQGLKNVQPHKEIKKIVTKITEKNQTALNKYKPEKLILGTPESYNSFTSQQLHPTCITLPKLLLDTLSQNQLHPVHKTVALHKACELEKDAFYQPIKTLLTKIPGITVVDLEERCNHTGFEELTWSSKQAALNVLSEAINKEADVLICTSPYCQAHVLLSQRKGSWCTVNLKVSDIYQLLLTSLQRDA